MEYEARHNSMLILLGLDALQQSLYQATIKNSGLPWTHLLEKSPQYFKRHHSCLNLPLQDTVRAS